MLWCRFFENRKGNTHNHNKETRAMSLAREKAIRDYSASIIFAKNEGLAEGERKANVETAKNLLAEGLDIGIIERSTGLSNEEIRKLQY